MRCLVKNLIFAVLLTLMPVFYIYAGDAQAGGIRKPAYAGSFYPADQAELSRLLERLTQEAEKNHIRLPAVKPFKALILPHAGYIYSGLTAAHASQALSGKNFTKIILLGPDHRIGFSNCAVGDADAYETPLGLIKLHADAKRLLKQPELFRTIIASDRAEHSIEVILPFLQFYLKNFKIIPIVTGHCDIDKLTGAVEKLLDEKTLVIASSDLSHYLPYEEAVKRDKDTIDKILALDYEKLLKKDNSACGKIPVTVLIKMALHHNWQPVLLHYSNSGDTAGGRSRVVGYAAIAFYGESLMKNISSELNEEHGRILLDLARQTIMKKLGIKVDKNKADQLATALRDDQFKIHRGTFVTLNIDGDLRGCIGNLSDSDFVKDGVRKNAVNAAFHDPRFPALSKNELKKIEIEISILSEPKPLEYKNGADLIKKLKVNVDGVILRKDMAGATFLPQVWKQ
ncbi:MAG: AmmeMemoRadiSam system protein B, partial [Deltaproteobacteria bacterium]|nr:AmmeMemoRadiSam system protein B [Deltaproteobacteria bacterium]